MRASLLTYSSISLVILAVGAVTAPAFAQQEVPVVYRTDPGPAHPRFATPDVEVRDAVPMQIVEAPAQIAGSPAPGATPAPMTSVQSARAYNVAARYPADTLYGNTSRGTISVQPGDTVYGIARRFKVPPNAIISTNRLPAPYELTIGQILTIPDVSVVPTSTAGTVAPTPVAIAVAASPTPVPSTDRVYIVRQGDTVYGLSRRFGLSVDQLATANGLYAPYNLSINQSIRIPMAGAYPTAPITTESTISPVVTPSPVVVPNRQPASVQPILVSKNPNSRFAWPLRGALLREYGMDENGQRYDGISIAAPIGAPIRAADNGEVVYVGAELEGYGNLLLVSHDDGWVSAYAHTDSIVVRKGDRVRQGQVVAKVGDSGGVAQPQLHFELRHDLQPRDPLAALTGQDRMAQAIVR